LRNQANITNHDRLYNILSALVLSAVLALGVFSIILFQNPNNPINPFPPPTMPVALLLPSATNTILPARNNETPLPTSTLLLAATGTTTAPPPSPTYTNTHSPEPTATVTPASQYRYQIQGEPAAIAAVLFNPDRADCGWMGVAGQVDDMQDRPVTGILVLLGGQMESTSLSLVMMTGTALNYGPAGYEFELADHQVATSGKLWIQLVDQSYIPLSAKVYFDTFAEEGCGKNLIIINFKQMR
jgi:hypothetical protein